MKTLLTLMTCLMVWGTSFAQKLNTITGKIVDEKTVSVPFAVIQLLNASDTSKVKIVAADIDGGFRIDQVKDGSYVLSISVVGFKTKKTERFVLNGDLELPIIKIESNTKQLNEVSVSVKKPYVEHQID